MEYHILFHKFSKSVAVYILLVAPELALEVECLAALVTLGRPQPLVGLVDVLTQVCELLLASGTLVLEKYEYILYSILKHSLTDTSLWSPCGPRAPV